MSRAKGLPFRAMKSILVRFARKKHGGYRVRNKSTKICTFYHIEKNIAADRLNRIINALFIETKNKNSAKKHFTYVLYYFYFYSRVNYFYFLVTRSLSSLRPSL